jgi:hypothetical protein
MSNGGLGGGTIGEFVDRVDGDSVLGGQRVGIQRVERPQAEARSILLRHDPHRRLRPPDLHVSVCPPLPVSVEPPNRRTDQFLQVLDVLLFEVWTGAQERRQLGHQVG